MSTYALVNPRRRRSASGRFVKSGAKRRRKRVTHVKRAKARRRRANPFVMNARRPARRRRRRVHAARRLVRRRRRHANPRIPGIGGAMRTIHEALPIALGAVACNVATGFVKQHLPTEWQSGPKGLAVKAGVGLIAIPALAGMLPMTRRYARPLALGAGIALALDVWSQYVAPMIPGLPLGEYDYGGGSLSGYETGQLSGGPDSTGAGVYDGGVYS